MTLLPIWAEPASQLVWIPVLLPKSRAAPRAASFSAPRTPIMPLLGVDAAISSIPSVPRS